MTTRAKIYDRAYFERWYRNDRTRVHARGALERKVRFAVAAAEHLLERPLRSVLDVGCGEGVWQPLIHGLRPAARYAGVDSSEYAVRRFGRRRNLRLGTFRELGEIGLEGPFDLIVCSDVLHYVPTAEIAPGLEAMAEMLTGVAFIEVFAAGDRIEGDLHEMKPRRPSLYDRWFAEAGLVHCGLYCFVRANFAAGITAFERGRG